MKRKKQAIKPWNAIHLWKRAPEKSETIAASAPLISRPTLPRQVLPFIYFFLQVKTASERGFVTFVGAIPGPFHHFINTAVA
jgi:hypothetical protein